MILIWWKSGEIFSGSINILYTTGEAAGLMINISKCLEARRLRSRWATQIFRMSLSLSISAAYCLETMIMERRLGKE